MSKSWNILKAVVAQIVIMMAVLHHGRVEAFLNMGQIKTKSHFSLSSPSTFIQVLDQKLWRVDASDITVIHKTHPQFTVSYGTSMEVGFSRNMFHLKMLILVPSIFGANDSAC